jgi:hypothetical protein
MLHNSPFPAAAQPTSYLPFESTKRDPNDGFVPRTASTGEPYEALQSAIAALDLVADDPAIGPIVRDWFEQDHLQACTLITDPRYDAWYRRACVLDAEIWATRAPTVGGVCWKLREVLLGLVAEEMTDGSTYRAAKSAFLDLEAMWHGQRVAASVPPAESPLLAIEREIERLYREEGEVLGTDTPEDRALFERIQALEGQIYAAPINSAADAAVVLRRLGDAEVGFANGDRGDELQVLGRLLAYVERISGGRPAGVRALHPDAEESGAGSVEAKDGAEILPFSVAAE